MRIDRAEFRELMLELVNVDEGTFVVADDVIVLDEDATRDNDLTPEVSATSVRYEPLPGFRILPICVMNEAVIPELLKIVVFRLAQIEITLEMKLILILPVNFDNCFYEAMDEARIHFLPPGLSDRLGFRWLNCVPAIGAEYGHFLFRCFYKFIEPFESYLCGGVFIRCVTWLDGHEESLGCAG